MKLIILGLIGVLAINIVNADWFDGVRKNSGNKIAIVGSAIGGSNINPREENDITTEESHGVTKPTEVTDTSKVTEPSTTETPDIADTTEETGTDTTETTEESSTETTEESSTDTTETTEESSTDTTETTEESSTDTTETTEESSTDTTETTEESSTDTTETTEESSTDTTETTEESSTETIETTEDPITTDSPTTEGPTLNCPGFHALPGSCINYTYCAIIAGEMHNYTLTCPKGQQFNNETNFCDANFKCNATTTSTTAAPTTTVAPTTTKPPAFDCPDEGFYPLSGSCMQYAYCADIAGDIKYFSLTCPKGQQFNYNNNLCESNFDCMKQ